MTITIRVKTGNAAFEDDPTGEQNAIVQKVAREIANGDRRGSIRDSNGNTVGDFRVTGWKD